MCWYSKNELTKLVASKDIECYKNFSLAGITFEQKSIFKFKFGKKLRFLPLRPGYHFRLQ